MREVGFPPAIILVTTNWKPQICKKMIFLEIKEDTTNFGAVPYTVATCMFLRRTHVQQSKRWWHSPLLTLYESLTLTDQVQSVDLIVVMAGRMEWKQYGLDLLRAGLTPHLLLSGGRFEVSKMKCLELPCFEELLRLRDKTRPDERHFFVNLDRSGARVHKVKVSGIHRHFLRE